MQVPRLDRGAKLGFGAIKYLAIWLELQVIASSVIPSFNTASENQLCSQEPTRSPQDDS